MESRKSNCADSPRVGGGYLRGYDPPEGFKKELKNLSETCFFLSFLTALRDHAMIIFGATVGILAWNISPLLAAISYPLIALWSAKAFRGLENMVHEGAHYNWTRWRLLNDASTNLLAAFPVFSNVAAYRDIHSTHHNKLGSEADGDRQRYEALNLSRLDRRSFIGFTESIATRLPRYWLGWWQAIGSKPASFMIGLVWYMVAVFTPLLFIADLPSAVMITSLYWLVPQLTLLPILRLIGESGEHIYGTDKTVFLATISAFGKIDAFLCHPHGDQYHLVHHLWPFIPHWKLERAHRLLMALDPDGYGESARYRTRMLSEPTTGSQPVSKPLIKIIAKSIGVNVETKGLKT